MNSPIFEGENLHAKDRFSNKIASQISWPISINSEQLCAIFIYTAAFILYKNTIYWFKF